MVQLNATNSPGEINCKESMVNFQQRIWRIRLFSGPNIERFDNPFHLKEESTRSQASSTRFRSSRVAALLAYLAIHLDKYCSREELIDALWPDETDLANLKNRFRVTLSSLRNQLEPEGFPFDSVLDTTLAGCVRLRASAVWCDLVEFELAYKSKNFKVAADYLTGQLLPQLHDEWAHDLRSRIELISFDVESERVEGGAVGISKQAALVNHSLPFFFTSFVQSERFLESLSVLLISNRLITIVGTGGIGKTRLSIEVCRTSQTRTVFVPLAEATNDESTFEIILRQLGVGSQTRLSAKQQIEEVLRSIGPLRLILDNIEHLLEVSSDWIEYLLSLNEEIFIVCTSRRSVNIQGECVYRLEPMSCPTPGGKLDDYPATRLFMDRVKQSRPDFRFSEMHDEDVIAICQLVEGLPLGIELASAQIITRAIRQIKEIVETDLLALKSKHRGISERHRSLEAVAKSSFDRESFENIEFLGKLSVFRNSFTIDQAQVVTGDSFAEDRIRDLVQHSLISSLLEKDQMRFSLLGFVRKLAHERLTEEAQQNAFKRHFDYFMELAAKVEEGDLRTVECLDPEEANLQFVLMQADTQREDFWPACKGAIARYFIRGEHRAGLKLIQRYFPNLSDCKDCVMKRKWLVSALHVVPDVGTADEFYRILQRLDEVAEEYDDSVARTYVLIFQGEMEGAKGDFMNRVLMHRRAFDAVQLTSDTELYEVAVCHLSGSLHSLAIHDSITIEQKREFLREAGTLAEGLVKRVDCYSRRHPLSRLLLAVALHYQGEYTEAQTWFKEARISAERLQVVTVLMYCALFEKDLADFRGDQVRSRQLSEEYRRLRTQIGIGISPISETNLAD